MTRQNVQSVSTTQVEGTDRPSCALIMKDVMIMEQEEVAFYTFPMSKFIVMVDE